MKNDTFDEEGEPSSFVYTGAVNEVLRLGGGKRPLIISSPGFPSYSVKMGSGPGLCSPRPQLARTLSLLGSVLFH